jgi:hypothetical protein
MEIRKYLIAGGNSTALISGSVSNRQKVVQNLLKEVEQVGFINLGEFPTLEMMGGELCINAVIAFASTLEREGSLKTSGVKDSVKYANSNGKTTIFLPLDYEKKGDIIIFPGIGKKQLSRTTI